MAERLGFTASVEDKFTAPLRNLKTQMREISSLSGPVRATADMEGAVRSAGALSATLGALRSTLGSLAVAGGVAGAAFAAVASRLGSFSGTTQSLILLGREVDLTVNRLREMEAVGQRFSISPEQIQGGTRAFAKNLAEMRKAHGETFNWLSTVDKKAADKILGTRNAEDAHAEAWGYMESIRDPQRRKRAAEMLFGDQSFANLGSGIHGTLKKQFDDARQQLGKLDRDMEKKALETEQNLARLRETKRRAEEWAMAKGVAPSANRIGNAVTDIARDDGKDVLGKIAENSKKLEVIDWAAIAAGIAAVGGSLRLLGAGRALSLLGLGGPWGWAAGIAGALGYSALRPKSQDELRARVDDLKQKRDTLQQELAGATPDSAAAIAKAARLKMIEDRLKEAELQLGKTIKQSLTEGGAAAAKTIGEKLRDLFTPSSANAAGLGPLIQNASLGGTSARDLAFGSRSPAFGAPGARGGGFFSGGGGRAPGGGMSGGAGGPATGSEASRIAAAKAAMIEQLRAEGVPEDRLTEASNLLAGQALAESGINPRQVHDRGTGLGVYGARNERRDAMLAWLQKNGFDRDSLEGQSRYMAVEAMGGRYRRTRDALMNADPADRARNTHAITREFENPKIVNDRTGHVARAAGVAPRRQQDQAQGQAGEPGAPLVEGGHFTSAFGMRRHPISGQWKMHAGVDLAAKGGSAARARQDGTVTGVNEHGDVTLKYSDGSTGVYRHIDASVEQGQKINAGDTLGTLKHRGTDNRMTGPHLHYESRDADGNLVNPRAAMDAGIVGVRNRMTGMADAIKSFGERSQAFAMPEINNDPSRGLLRDARSSGLIGGGGAMEFKGGADLRIKLDGFPAGTRTNTSVDGMISNVSVDRGRQIVNARRDE